LHFFRDIGGTCVWCEQKSSSTEKSTGFRRIYFAAYCCTIQWNKKIEKDIFAGRLDVLGKQAEAEFITGRTEPL
jgi:hypothetical protein